MCTVTAIRTLVGLSFPFRVCVCPLPSFSGCQKVTFPTSTARVHESVPAPIRAEWNPHFRYNNLTLIRSQIMLHFLCANVVVVKCQRKDVSLARGSFQFEFWPETKWNSNGCINALSALPPTPLAIYIFCDIVN